MIILIIFGATALGLIITGITLKAVAHNMRRKQTREGGGFLPHEPPNSMNRAYGYWLR